MEQVFFMDTTFILGDTVTYWVRGEEDNNPSCPVGISSEVTSERRASDTVHDKV